MGKRVRVSNPLQPSYVYACSAPVGRDFDPLFTPQLTPPEMVRLGVFGGAYFSSVTDEYPQSWWRGVDRAPYGEPNAAYNYFGVLASQSREEWVKKGWIHPDDPHGWFEWYCRYYLGRRHSDDTRQIKRWRAMRRHIAQIQHHCRSGDVSCRPRQRQALLQWAYDCRLL